MQKQTTGRTNQATSIKDRYLTFDLETEKYGVEILMVKEIIGMQETIKVPRTPDYVKGIMNLRGKVIPVIDLRVKLNMPETEPQMDTAVIIVFIRDVNVGFVVDRVDEVASIAKDHLESAPTFGIKVNADFIKYMAQDKEKVIMILDLEKIFDVQELEKIKGLGKDSE